MKFKMKILPWITAAIPLFPIGCTRTYVEIKPEVETTYTVNIDGCFYIAWKTHDGSWNYTHKGNCPNHAFRVTDLKTLEATSDSAK